MAAVAYNIPQPVLKVAEIEARFDQIEREVLEGKTLSSEEVHRNIAAKCP